MAKTIDGEGWSPPGKQGLPSHISGPWRRSSGVGNIWKDAPTNNSAEQGVMIHFNPRLFDVTASILVDVDPDPV